MKTFCVKSAIVFCLLTIFVCAARARENCVWTNRTADVSLNLRLGMTTAEVRALVGRDLSVKLRPRGDYRFFQNYINNDPPPRFRGVRALYLRFFEQRLYQIEVFYEENFSPSLEDFAGIVARQFNFPVSEWIYENKKAVIRCGEKTLAADYVLNPRIEFTDEAILAKVNELNKSK